MSVFARTTAIGIHSEVHLVSSHASVEWTAVPFGVLLLELVKVSHFDSHARNVMLHLNLRSQLLQVMLLLYLELVNGLLLSFPEFSLQFLSLGYLLSKFLLESSKLLGSNLLRKLLFGLSKLLFGKSKILFGLGKLMYKEGDVSDRIFFHVVGHVFARQRHLTASVMELALHYSQGALFLHVQV